MTVTLREDRYAFCIVSGTVIFRIRNVSGESFREKSKQFQTLHREGKLIPEQSPGETNPLFQTVINPQPPHTT